MAKKKVTKKTVTPRKIKEPVFKRGSVVIRDRNLTKEKFYRALSGGNLGGQDINDLWSQYQNWK